MESTLPEAAAALRCAERVVSFTGAGMSAESGIPTFRDDDGFWQRFPIDTFATWRGLVRTALLRPKRLAEFIYEVIEPIANALPNAGHLALEQLEHELPVTVVTQNIDGLHQRAGNTTTWQIHGSVYELVDRRRRFRSILSHRELQRVADGVGRSRRGLIARARLAWAVRKWIGVTLRGVHFPNLVLFGDGLAEPDWTESLAAARQCDCMLQVGCSGVVLPAAMLPHEARANGATIIAIDPHPVPEADLWLRGNAATVLPALVDAVGSR